MEFRNFAQPNPMLMQAMMPMGGGAMPPMPGRNPGSVPPPMPQQNPAFHASPAEQQMMRTQPPVPGQNPAFASDRLAFGPDFNGATPPPMPERNGALQPSPEEMVMIEDMKRMRGGPGGPGGGMESLFAQDVTGQAAPNSAMAGQAAPPLPARRDQPSIGMTAEAAPQPPQPLAAMGTNPNPQMNTPGQTPLTSFATAGPPPLPQRAPMMMAGRGGNGPGGGPAMPPPAAVASAAPAPRPRPVQVPSAGGQRFRPPGFPDMAEIGGTTQTAGNVPPGALMNAMQPRVGPGAVPSWLPSQNPWPYR